MCFQARIAPLGRPRSMGSGTCQALRKDGSTTMEPQRNSRQSLELLVWHPIEVLLAQLHFRSRQVGTNSQLNDWESGASVLASPPFPNARRDGRALSFPRRGRMYARRGRICAGRVRAAGYTRASYSTQAGREPADSCRPHTPSAAWRISPTSRPRNYQRSRRLGDCSRGSKPQSNGPRSLACWRGPSAGRVRILMVCMPSSLGTAWSRQIGS